MQLLILGGTAQLGRAVASVALRMGHDVTCLARGESGQVPDGARLVVGDRDDDDGLAEVRGASRCSSSPATSRSPTRRGSSRCG